MNVHASDSEVFMTALTEHAQAGTGDHPGVEALMGYLAGDLADKIEAEVNDHLVGCRRCAAQLLDLEPLSQPEIPREGVADLATEAAWREIRARLFTVEETPLPAARPAARQRWAIAVAASLLLTTAGMSAWVARLYQSNSEMQWRIAELSQPQVNAPHFYLGETTRSSGVETIEVQPGQPRFGLIFNSAELGDYAEYEIRFSDPEGREVLPIAGLELSESASLRLVLPRGLLPAGEYRVAVSGFDGERWQLLEEHRRRIVYLEGS